MPEFQNKSAGVPKMLTASSANERARGMVIALGGQRGWSDTRGSWLARVARVVGLSPRRVRAIFYLEPIRLSADEYISIQAAFERNHSLLRAADAALASVPDLAGPADAGPIEPAGQRSDTAPLRGRPSDRSAREGATAAD